MYGELRQLEKDLESSRARESRQDLRARLDRLEEKASHLRVPTFYADLLYALRLHISVVRERLTRTEDAGG
jgi:hypothetical protein